MIRQAVILCGGEGRRLRPLTDNIPKPMIEVKGRPFVTYLITILEDVGVEDIVLSVGYLKEQFHQLEGRVRLSDAKPVVNDSVLAVSDLEELFILANGDCLPILKWRDFLNTDRPRVAVKDGFDKDAGICIMSKSLLPSVYCGNIRSLISDERFDKFIAYSNLSIDTPEKLGRAREFITWWWKEKAMKAPPDLYKKIIEVFPRPCVDIVLTKGDAVLLLQREIEPNKGTWALPGGVVEKGESQGNACYRKVYQETGLKIVPDDLRLATVIDWFLPERHDICNTYTVEVKGNQPIKLDFQHSRYRWVPAGSLGTLNPPLHKNICEQIIAALRDSP